MLGLVGRHALVAPAPFTVVQQNPACIGIDAVTPAPFVETGAEAGFGQVRARQASAGHHRGAVVVLDAVLAVGAVRGDVVARTEAHTSELQSLIPLSHAVSCSNKKYTINIISSSITKS